MAHCFLEHWLWGDHCCDSVGGWDSCLHHSGGWRASGSLAPFNCYEGLVGEPHAGFSLVRWFDICLSDALYVRLGVLSCVCFIELTRILVIAWVSRCGL